MQGLSYRELIGTILWFSNRTRPDITHSVTTSEKFSANSALKHRRAALRVLGYIQQMKYYFIEYTQQLAHDTIISRGHSRGYLLSYSDYKFYIDASFASDPDSCRCIMGSIFCISVGPVSWRSRMQTPEALSSMEAEYMATTAVTQ
jgi:hypothetical protein